MCTLCDIRHGTGEGSDAGPAELGSAALFAYLTGRPLQATILIDACYHKFGQGGIYMMATAWCDLFLDWLPERKRGTPVHLMWKETDTGLIRNADQIPPVARWAGRMIASRSAGDDGASQALFDGLPDDKTVYAEHLEGLLQALALQLQARSAGGAA
jgi:hypothetical protein